MDDHTLVANELLATLWLGASRYFIGRQTILTHAFCDSLIEEIDNIPDDALITIEQDLKRAIEDDNRDRARGRTALTLGDDVDRNKWLQVKAAITYCLNERTKKDAN